MASKRGRPRKTGLDWFPFELGLLTDRKLRVPRAHHGRLAVLVYEALLSLIYADKGYYLKYEGKRREGIELDVADMTIGKEPAKTAEIREVIAELVENDLFDAELFEQGILTSKRIQKTYYNAATQRKKIIIDWDIWLLSEIEMDLLGDKNPILTLYRKEKCDLGNIKLKKTQKIKEKKIRENKIIQQNRGEDTLSSTSVEVSGADAPREDLTLYEDYWNHHVAEPNGLPKVRGCSKWSASRKKNLRERIREEGAQGVLDVFDKAARSDYLCGKVDNWHMDFDWVIMNKNFQKIAEGRFDNYKSKAKETSSMTYYEKLARGEI